MKKISNNILLILLCFFISCEDGDAGGSQIPSKIVVSPLNPILKPNQSVQLYALVIDTKNKEIEEAKVIWSSGDASVGVVDEKGMLIAKSRGSTNIKASFEGVEGIAEISVADTRRRILSEMFTSST